MTTAISAVMLASWRKVNDAIGIAFDDIPADHLTPVLEELRISKQITAIEAVQAAACFKKLSELSPAQRQLILAGGVVPAMPAGPIAPVHPPLPQSYPSSAHAPPPPHAASPLASFSDYDTQRAVWSAPVDSSASWPSESEQNGGGYGRYQQFPDPNGWNGVASDAYQYDDEELTIRPNPVPLSYSASVGAAALPPLSNPAGPLSSLASASKPSEDKKTNGSARVGDALDSDRSSQSDKDSKPAAAASGKGPAEKRPMCYKHCLCKDGVNCPNLHSKAEQRIFKIMSRTNPKVKTKLCFSYADGKRCYFDKTPEDCFGAHGPKDGWCAFCGACGHFVPECPVKSHGK